MKISSTIAVFPALVLGLAACPGDDGPMGSESSSTSTGADSTSTTMGPVTIDPTAVDSTTTEGTESSGTTTMGEDTTTTMGEDTSTTTMGEESTSTTGGCMGDQVLCDGACIDPATDPDYCGAVDDCMDQNAGTVCGKGQECVDGQCECMMGLLCDGACIDPQVDLLYCGAMDDCMGPNAGEQCMLSAECVAGACVDTCDNCSFETGDFTGWTTVDLLSPYFPLTVDPGGYMDGLLMSFTTTPTDGGFCAVTGFDGDGPGTIEIGQDITVAPAPPANLTFDYRAAWDLAMFGAMVDRTLEVHIEPAGGGMPMDTVLILTAPVGDFTSDTGDQMGVVDLSAYAGQTIFINFVFNVPENFSGPALAQIDNVQVVPQ